MAVPPTTTYDYDALNRPIRQYEPDPATPTQTLGTITSALDGQGQVRSLSDPRGLTTNYQRDGLGNLLSEASPDRGTIGNTYDAAGNPLTRTDARGNSATSAYDALGRVTTITYPDQTIIHTWDTCANGLGRLCCLDDASGSRLWSYDPHGRITATTQALAGGVTLTQQMSYGADGRPTSLDPANPTVTLGTITGTLHGQGQIRSVSDPRGLVTTYLRDGLGNVVTETSMRRQARWSGSHRP